MATQPAQGVNPPVPLIKSTDIFCKLDNPEWADMCLESLGATLLGDDFGNYLMQDGCYVVRAFNNPVRVADYITCYLNGVVVLKRNGGRVK